MKNVLCFALLAMGLTFGARAEIVLTPDNAEVLIQPKPFGTTMLAAEEMTNALSRAFGRTVSVVTAPTAGKVQIVIGTNEWSEAAGIDVMKLPRDGFVIRTAAPSRIYIAGRDERWYNFLRDLHAGSGDWRGEHASAFGVYEFLERFADVRFYFPGDCGTLVPRREKIVVPDTDFVGKPDFLQRQYYSVPAKMPADIARSGKGYSWLRLRMETENIPCCHGSNRFRYMQRFAKSHPEYFALRADGSRCNRYDGVRPSTKDGFLCWSSPVVDEVEKDVLSYLRGEDASVRGIPTEKPGQFAWGKNCQRGRYVDIMPNDAFVKCTCEKCRAAWTDDPNYASDLIWGVTKRIAQKVQDEGLAGYITQMAYFPNSRVPAFSLPTNILVMTAVGGPFTLSDPKTFEQHRAHVHAWGEKMNRKTWIWTYPLKEEGQNGAPQMCPRAWGRYYKALAPDIFGALAESESDLWFFNHLNYYVFSKVCWDNSTDVDALLEEYYRRMFGAAAPEMKAIYEDMEETWMTRVVGKCVETNLGPVFRKPDPSELWTKVYSPEKLASWKALAKKGAAKLSPGSEELVRLRYVVRELIKPVLDASKAFLESSSPACELKRRAAHPEEVSIVPDGDFEEPVRGRSIGPWIGPKDVRFARDTTTFVTGASSVRLEGCEKGMDLHCGLPLLKPDTRYRLSFFLKMDDLKVQGRGGFHITLHDFVCHGFPERLDYIGTMDWTHCSFEFTTNKDAGTYPFAPYVRLILSKNTSGTVWVDGLILTEMK